MGVGGEDCFPALFFAAKALTSIRRVDCGRWKLVRRPLTIRNLWPGLRKMLVWPEWGSEALPLSDLGAVFEGAGGGGAGGDDAAAFVAARC